MRCPTCAAPNPAGMRFCGKCGGSLQKNALGRERRSVSVVFVDLSGFSTLTRNWLPEALRDLADEVLTVVAGVIEDYDGYVDAFQGDGLIALFGAPHSHPDDPYRAVMAAAAALKAIEGVGQGKDLPLQGRAGVNTGVVIAGSIGSGRVREYTVMGSAVNLAARLEAAAQPGEVWVGPETFEATRHRILFKIVGPVTLNGFPNIREVYKLVSLAEAVPSDPYAELRFVGRRAELEHLKRALDVAARARRAHSLWLSGEAGIGKTRLLREFGLGLPNTVKTIWLEDQSADPGRPWRQLAQQLFAVPSGEDSRSYQQEVSAHLSALLPDEPRWQRYILSSLGLVESRPWRRPERRSVDRALLAWRDLVAAFVQREREQKRLTAALILAENASFGATLHPFLELFDDLDQPLLIIRSTRERELPPEAEHLALPRFGMEDSLALVRQLANPILKVATESLVMQVGGVPSNILELGRALSITPQGSFSGSLASLLQARLDMLGRESRQMLVVAALCGEQCWGELLLAVTGAEDPALLEQLIAEKLLLKNPGSSLPGRSEYRFQSELVRRAVLRMIPSGERPALHLGIASWLERHAPLALSELVALHFREGHSPEAAYPHYLAAADLAVGERDFERAFTLFDTLLSLELSPSLLAQGTLAYAQAAISSCDKTRALEQLSAADQWIELSSGEGESALRGVHAQLFQDLSSCGG